MLFNSLLLAETIKIHVIVYCIFMICFKNNCFYTVQLEQHFNTFKLPTENSIKTKFVFLEQNRNHCVACKFSKVFQIYQKVVFFVFFFVDFDKNQQNPNKQRDWMKNFKNSKTVFPVRKRAKKCKKQSKITLVSDTMDQILTLFWPF